MKIQYFPDTDTLHLEFKPVSFDNADVPASVRGKFFQR